MIESHDKIKESYENPDMEMTKFEVDNVFTTLNDMEDNGGRI